MPATAGRVRMPHNNRMSTSAALKTSDIWSKTIGHDPYAGQDEKDDDADHATDQAKNEEKARSVLAAVKQQNLTDNSNRDDFSRKLYLGLREKKKKLRATDERSPAEIAMLERERLQQELKLHGDDSSSEDEIIQVEINEDDEEDSIDHRKKSRRKTSSKKKKKSSKRKKRSSSHKQKRKHKRSSEDDSGCTTSSSESDSSESDDDSSSDSEDSRRKRRKRDDKRRRSRHRSDKKQTKKRSRSRRSSRHDDTEEHTSGSSDNDRRRSKKKRYTEDSDDKKVDNSIESNHDNGDAKTGKESSSRQQPPENVPIDFIPSKRFCGSKKGYVFKMDDKGIGYYLDVVSEHYKTIFADNYDGGERKKRIGCEMPSTKR